MKEKEKTKGKTLRVCLAMGGGVSLGSFSGSALTEALKLLIIYGKDKEDKPYDRVVVDGMSGASAGAIALTIMMRCLIDYESMLPKWEPKDGNDNIIPEELRDNHLEKLIKETYFENNPEGFSKLGPELGDLKALQLAQEIQEVLWVDMVSAKKLFGKKKYSHFEHDINDSFGLLERAYMEKLTEDYLMDGKLNLNNLKVLDKQRVIFACSLTNILPMPINTKPEGLNQLQRNVLNSTGVFNHAEVRVIDFVFDESIDDSKPSDSRWLNFSESPNMDIPTHFNIKLPVAWATISASALACGAFPVAFPPVLLKRYQEEYNLGHATEATMESFMASNIQRKVFKDTSGNEVVSEWPGPFLDIQNEIKDTAKNCFFNDKDSSVLDYKTFNFPYVDGGTFNNEPIKEAYRIGSFQDFRREDFDDAERLVLFVDPIVRKEQSPDFRVSSFSPIKGTQKTKASSEIDKLIGSLGSLVGLLKNQGRIKETDKIRDIKESFTLKKEIFEYLDENDQIKLTVDICLSAFDKIRKKLNDDIISIGTRNPVEYFVEELRKNSNGSWKGTDFPQLFNKVKKQSELGLDTIKDKADLTLEKIYKKFGIKEPDDTSKNIFAATVFKVITEVSLNTAGKNPCAINAAILPIDKDNNIMDLPGTEIQAFAGFASLTSKKYAFQYARLATLKSLSAEEGFREEAEGGAYLKDNKKDDLKNLNAKFVHEIRSTNFFSEDNNYSADLKQGLFNPGIRRIKTMLPKWLKPFWNVPLSAVSIGAVFKGLWENVKGKRFSLQSILRTGANEMVESVKFLYNEPLIITIKGDKKFHKPWYRYLSGKTKVKVKATLVGGKTVKIRAYRDIKEPDIIRFHLFMVKDSDYIRKTSAGTALATSGNGDNAKLKIVTEHRIKLPSIVGPEEPNYDPKNAKLDPNLDKKWLSELRKNYPKEVTKLKIEGVKEPIPLDPDYINNRERSLYYSLRDLKIHVNPSLEYYYVPEKKGVWYFKENTKSFHEELLDRKKKKERID